MAEIALPSFRRPPVIETVLGVQFDRIAGLTNAYLGAFWKYLSARRGAAKPEETWTTVCDAPLITPAFERFGDQQAWSPDRVTLRLTQEPLSRLQIRNARGDAMIQVQNGRLHYNWLAQGGKDYERYTRVRAAFDAVFAEFCAFLAAEKLGEFRANQWEVTYVNHISEGTVWSRPADWAKLFPGLPGIWNKPTEVVPESFGGSWHFEIPPQRGRLHVDLKHAILERDEGHGLLRLTLTARGPIDATSLSDGLDLGRRVIVLTFRDVTSADAHRFWGLKL